jgi:integrase
MPPGHSLGPLSAVIAIYIGHKRAAGNEYISEEQQFRRLDALADQLGCPADTLSKEVVLAWTEKRPHEKSLTQTKRINAVKRFALFMRERGYEAYMYPYPPERAAEPYLPHIFTESEMGLLLGLSDQYLPTALSPHLGLTVPLVFRLLYGCGLRTSEVLNLRTCDVDTDAGVLSITGAKFGKSRLVPMAASLTSRCAEYVRLTERAAGDDEYLLRSHQSGGRYSDQAIYHWFRNLLSRSGIPHLGKGGGPRVHDIRHSFAVHRLKMWAREGKDMRAMLPILSTYMGHCDLRGTQIYLRLTPDLFSDIAETMGNFFVNDGKGAV